MYDRKTASRLFDTIKDIQRSLSFAQFLLEGWNALIWRIGNQRVNQIEAIKSKNSKFTLGSRSYRIPSGARCTRALVRVQYFFNTKRSSCCTRRGRNPHVCLEGRGRKRLLVVYRKMRLLGRLGGKIILRFYKKLTDQWKMYEKNMS